MQGHAVMQSPCHVLLSFCCMPIVFDKTTKLAKNHLAGTGLECWVSCRRKVTGSLKITHDAWKKTKDKETKKDKVPAELKDQFQDAMKCNEQIEAHLTKVH